MSVDGHMSDLAAAAVGAGDHLSIHDDTAADAGTQGDHDHIFVTLAAALPHLAEGSHIGVVAHGRRHPESGLDLVSDLLPAPAQIDTDIHGTIGAYRTRHTDADTCKVFFRQRLLSHHLPTGSRHIF